MKNKKVRINLLDIKTGKTFYKEFETEFERDKFIRKLKFSKKIKVIETYKDDWED